MVTITRKNPDGSVTTIGKSSTTTTPAPKTTTSASVSSKPAVSQNYSNNTGVSSNSSLKTSSTSSTPSYSSSSSYSTPSYSSSSYSTPSYSAPTSSDTVQIKSPNTGNYMTVKVGSQIHQNYLKNNPSAIDQSSVTTTYNTPDKYNYSENVKSFDQNGQQSFSSSGYTGAITPSFNVSSNVTNLVNQIKQQEAQMRQTWASSTKDGYNDLISNRNKMTGDLLNLITTESAGKASLSEIESILGRRLENQEMEAYRNAFTTNELQQSQLNNLWEHDFGARNNGETYQYYLNYLNNGTGGDVLAESQRQYFDNMTPEDKAKYMESMNTSMQSTQDYFNQRNTGWTPGYVNNTANPAAYGEVDAGAYINSGGASLQQQIDDYNAYQVWLQNGGNPNDPFGEQQTTLQQQQQQSSIDALYAQMLAEQQAQQQALEAQLEALKNENNYKQSEINNTAPSGTTGTTGTTSGHVYSPGQSANQNGYVQNQLITNETFYKYLQDIYKGGF